MIQIPDYVICEMLAITKVLSERCPAESTRYKNAIRRAIILRKKLCKLNKPDRQMDALKEHVFATIQEIVNRKKADNKFPAHALYSADLRPSLAGYCSEDIHSAINALCEEGRIKWGQTMHDKYFTT